MSSQWRPERGDVEPVIAIRGRAGYGVGLQLVASGEGLVALLVERGPGGAVVGAPAGAAVGFAAGAAVGVGAALVQPATRTVKAASADAPRLKWYLRIMPKHPLPGKKVRS